MGWWLALGRSGEVSRWTAASAETAVQRSRWDDGRIVLGTRCLPLDPIVQGTDQTPATVASQFDCQVNFVLRPVAVSQTEWDEMGGAIRSNDRARATELLGIPANATAADVDAASRRWGLDGSNTSIDVVGIRATSPTDWTRRATPQFDTSTFTQADQLRYQLLLAIPAVEAFYVDHHTYAGMTLPALRAIDANVGDRVAILSATDATYCAQATDGQITWSEQGPGGAPLPRICKQQ